MQRGEGGEGEGAVGGWKGSVRGRRNEKKAEGRRREKKGKENYIGLVRGR